MNRLFASVPPETNITCEGCTFTSAATCSRAVFTAVRAACRARGGSTRCHSAPRRNGSIASSTRSSSGVVAL